MNGNGNQGRGAPPSGADMAAQVAARLGASPERVAVVRTLAEVSPPAPEQRLDWVRRTLGVMGHEAPARAVHPSVAYTKAEWNALSSEARLAHARSLQAGTGLGLRRSGGAFPAEPHALAATQAQGQAVQHLDDPRKVPPGQWRAMTSEQRRAITSRFSARNGGGGGLMRNPNRK
jgi:hypothetical protein